MFTIALAAPAHADWFSDESNCRQTKLNDPAAFSKDIIQALAINSIEKNPSDFCNLELAQRFLFTNSSEGYKPKSTYPEFEDALLNGHLNQLINSKAAKDRKYDNDNWTSSLLPTVEARLMPTTNIETGIVGLKKSMNLDEAIMQLQKDRCGFARQLGNGGSLPEDDEIGPIVKKAASIYACSELMGISKSLSCNNSMKTVERIAATRGGLTGTEIFKKVLSDSRYDEGLRLAALKIASRVKEKNLQGDYFSDLKDSFVSSGFDEFESEEMAWSTSALLATAGPNTNFRILAFKGEPEDSQKRIALHTIAACLPILDHLSSSKGQLYSFPPGVSGACNTGKSYHFWYTAYLARRAALESGNPEASAASAFQAEKAYHLGHRSADVNQIASSSLFTPTSQVIRGDLSYAAVGAVFGANAAGDRKIILDVDKNLESLIKAGGAGKMGLLPSVAGLAGDNQLKTYGAWMKKFDSNSAFNNARKAGFPKSVKSPYLDFEKNARAESCDSDRRSH